MDGGTKFRSWKTKIILVLDENEIQNNVKENVLEPKNVEEKAKHKTNEAKAKRNLIDSIKDHLIPHVAELKTAKKMYDALVGLFESKNNSRKLTLRHQLHSIMMSRLDSVATYLMRVFRLRDQLNAIGDTIDDVELVTMTLNGFPSSWDPFVKGICTRIELPKFDRLWINCVQEEARLLSKNNLQISQDDETQALATHARKGKERRNIDKKHIGGRLALVQEQK